MLAAAEDEALRRLQALGVRLSADDFGTGYASLGHLKRLALDEIKIDRSFVTDMVANRDDATIVHSTIDLAHSLGIRVVAEGVENPETWEQLAQLGCDFVQGFYVSRPIPGSDLGPWLRAPKCALPAEGSRAVNLAV
jgi:EAL domain-containing protein (putative c-di-GMP-specific phosphodiesterase class I)